VQRAGLGGGGEGRLGAACRLVFAQVLFFITWTLVVSLLGGPIHWTAVSIFWCKGRTQS